MLPLARERLAGGRPRRLAALIQNPALQRWGTQLARLAPRALSRPLRTLHGLHRLATALPANANAPPAGDYPPLRGAPRGRVGLFLGCASAAQQGGALQGFHRRDPGLGEFLFDIIAAGQRSGRTTSRDDGIGI